MIRTRVSNAIRMYEVYRFNQRSSSPPCELIDSKTASYWLSCGFATRVSKWRLRLKKPQDVKLRGESCSIRESTIHAALDRSKYHQSLIDAWGGVGGGCI